MIKKKLLKRCVALSMALILAVGAGSSGIIDAIATQPVGGEVTQEEQVDQAAVDAQNNAAAAIASALSEMKTLEGTLGQVEANVNGAQIKADAWAALQPTVDSASAIQKKAETQLGATKTPDTAVAEKAQSDYNEIVNVLNRANGFGTIANAKPDSLPVQTTPPADTTPVTQPQEQPAAQVQPNQGGAVQPESSTNAEFEYQAQELDTVVNTGSTVSVTAVQSASKPNDEGVYDITLDVNATTTVEKASETVIILDQSSSVSDPELAEMKTAANAYIAAMDENDSVAILTVADTVDGVKDANGNYVFANGKEELINIVNQLGIGRAVSQATDMNAALVKANELLAGSEAVKNIILLSDGGSTTAANEAAAVKALRDNNVKIFSIGYDEALVAGNNQNYLNSFAADQNDIAATVKAGTSKTAVAEIVNTIEADSQTTEVVATETTTSGISVTVMDTFQVVDNADATVTNAGLNKVLSWDATTIPVDGWKKTFQVEALTGVPSGDYEVIDGATSLVNGIAGNDVNAPFDTQRVPVEGVVTEVPSNSGYLLNEGLMGVSAKNDVVSSSDFELSKTTRLQGDTEDAKDIAFANRNYVIELDAWSTKKSTSIETTNKPASIVLLLDTSGSMDDNEVATLKNSAKEFVKQTLDASPNSEIAIIDFDSDAKVINGVWEWEGVWIFGEWVFKVDGHGTFTNNQDALEKRITDGVSGSGGATVMGSAFEEAATIMENATNKQNLHLIAFTDGVPTTSSGSERKETDKVINASNAMKGKYGDNLDIYTVGYGNADATVNYTGPNGNNAKTTSGKFLTNIATDKSSTEKHYYSTGSASEITDLFKEISQEITSYYGVKPYLIKDQLSTIFTMSYDDMIEVARQFYGYTNVSEVPEATITQNVTNYDSKGTPYNSYKWGNEEMGYLTIWQSTEPTENGAVDIPAGITVLEWSGEATKLVYRENTNGSYTEEASWSYEIPVSAQEEFLGGNLVQTNAVSQSGVFNEPNSTGALGSAVEKFPVPVVNVSPIGFDGKESTDVVFIQDKLGGENVLDGILAEVNAIPGLEIKSITNLLQGVMYSYPGFGTEQFGVVKISSITRNDIEIPITANMSESDLRALLDETATKELVGENIRYEVTLKYEPYAIEDRNVIDPETFLPTDGYHKHSDFGKRVAKWATELDGVFTHTVNVKAASITINKTITEMEDYAGDPIFTFKIERLGENDKAVETWYKTVRMTEVGTQIVGTIDYLPQGRYRVTELSSLRYDCTNVSMNFEPYDTADRVEWWKDTTEWEYIDANGEPVEKTSALGKELTLSKDYYKAIFTFTNAPDKRDDFTDNDVVENQYTWNSVTEKWDVLQDEKKER